MNYTDQPFSSTKACPDELAGPLPRATRISGIGLATLVTAMVVIVVPLAVALLFGISSWQTETGFACVVIFFCVLVAFLGALMLRQFPMQRQLMADGIPVVGSITECGYIPRSRFYVKYNFRAEDGQSWNGWGRCDHRRNIGDGVLVLYLPQNPRRNQPYPLDLYRAVQRFQ